MAKKGEHMSEETKRKISEAITGIKRSEETKRKISIAKTGQTSPRKGSKMTEEQKKKISIARSGNHYPKVSQALIGNTNHKGGFARGRNEHWNWKGGITPENHRLRTSTEFEIWRNEVFERDDYTCQGCGERGGRLHAHHIMFWNSFPEGHFLVANGQTLCIKCHKYLHKEVGY